MFTIRIRVLTFRIGFLWVMWIPPVDKVYHTIYRLSNFYLAPAFFDGYSTEKESKVIKQEEPVAGVPMDENNNACLICHEEFESYWDHEEEEWMFKGAIKIGDDVYHKVCYQEKLHHEQ